MGPWNQHIRSRYLSKCVCLEECVGPKSPFGRRTIRHPPLPAQHRNSSGQIFLVSPAVRFLYAEKLNKISRPLQRSIRPGSGKDRLEKEKRPVGCLKLQVIFRKRATNYRALLREMTYIDKDRLAKEKTRYRVARTHRMPSVAGHFLQKYH